MDYFTDTLKNFAEFSGRATRKQYWMFYLFYIIFAFVTGIVAGIFNADWLISVYVLVIFIPNISITARRLHDTGRSGWWQLIGIIPLIGWIILIYFLVLDSDDDNKWGRNPKAEFNV